MKSDGRVHAHVHVHVYMRNDKHGASGRNRKEYNGHKMKFTCNLSCFVSVHVHVHVECTTASVA